MKLLVEEVYFISIIQHLANCEISVSSESIASFSSGADHRLLSSVNCHFFMGLSLLPVRPVIVQVVIPSDGFRDGQAFIQRRLIILYIGIQYYFYLVQGFT